jgi:hypothetical protein
MSSQMSWGPQSSGLSCGMVGSRFSAVGLRQS